METNVGPVDRILRITLGAALMVLAAFGAIGEWGYFGILPLFTGIVRVCPAYALLRINTAQRRP